MFSCGACYRLVLCEVGLSPLSPNEGVENRERTTGEHLRYKEMSSNRISQPERIVFSNSGVFLYIWPHIRWIAGRILYGQAMYVAAHRGGIVQET